jgi:hypothetical protein
MTRKVLIAGLIVLAALLPLAPPPAIFILDAAFAVVAAAPSVVAQAPPAAFPALTVSRAPPLR